MVSTERQQGAQILRRLRETRGMSWDDLAGELRSLASRLRFTRVAAAKPASIKRTIARWEAAQSPPDARYQVLLAYLYARTPLGTVALGSGSDFRELLAALSLFGVEQERLVDFLPTPKGGGFQPSRVGFPASPATAPERTQGV
jgi:transcriptional regulator with XRE-family HTH domain